MPTPEKQVRVFISSTFRDMHAERDHLVTVVFPELRERVEQLGLEFFDVDLRWGVPAKDANGETANSWEYCRQWIDRVEPFFVCILGQRYGWVPEPEKLKAREDRQRQQVEKRSITDMEVRHAVLNTKLNRRSYFYLRATEAPLTAGEYVDPPRLLSKLEQLKNEVRVCGRPVREYPCEWTGSSFAAMEQFGRAVLDDLWSGVLRDERYVSKEVWRQVLGTDPDSDARYTDESKPVPPELAEQLVTRAKPAPFSPLDAEKQQMEAFAQSRLRWFEGRENELKQLTDFINSKDENSPRLAAVVAVPGQGKSALLAKVSTFISQPSTFLITHFVGATEGSASAHALVQRLLDELDRSGITWATEPQEDGQEPIRDFNSLCLRLAKRLGDYAGEQCIVILIDALNQLSDGHDLHWLPNRIGSSVRVIVSCVDTALTDSLSGVGGKGVDDRPGDGRSPDQRVLHALGSRQPAPLRVRLGPLAEADVRSIVVAYLQEYCKELDSEHVEAICDERMLPQARNPLYLLVMLNELRAIGGNDMNRVVPRLVAEMGDRYPDPTSLFGWVLQRLEVFGRDAVRLWCGYLAVSRAGMSGRELQDLVRRRVGGASGEQAARIERGLRRYLLRRGAQWDFFHGALRDAVASRYLPDDSILLHTDVAAYFEERRAADAHAISELLYHRAHAYQWDRCVGLLREAEFAMSYHRVASVDRLLGDVELGRGLLAVDPGDGAVRIGWQARLLLERETLVETARRLPTVAPARGNDDIRDLPAPRVHDFLVQRLRGFHAKGMTGDERERFVSLLKQYALGNDELIAAAVYVLAPGDVVGSWELARGIREPRVRVGALSNCLIHGTVPAEQIMEEAARMPNDSLRQRLLLPAARHLTAMGAAKFCTRIDTLIESDDDIPVLVEFFRHLPTDDRDGRAAILEQLLRLAEMYSLSIARHFAVQTGLLLSRGFEETFRRTYYSRMEDVCALVGDDSNKLRSWAWFNLAVEWASLDTVRAAEMTARGAFASPVACGLAIAAAHCDNRHVALSLLARSAWFLSSSHGMTYSWGALRLMHSVDGVSGIPTTGNRYEPLVILANVKNVIHFRIFDDDGNIVLATDETKLTTQTGPIEDLRMQLKHLRDRDICSRADKRIILQLVSSIVGPIPSFRSDELPPWPFSGSDPIDLDYRGRGLDDVEARNHLIALLCGEFARWGDVQAATWLQGLAVAAFGDDFAGLSPGQWGQLGRAGLEARPQLSPLPLARVRFPHFASRPSWMDPAPIEAIHTPALLTAALESSQEEENDGAFELAWESARVTIRQRIQDARSKFRSPSPPRSEAAREIPILPLSAEEASAVIEDLWEKGAPFAGRGASDDYVLGQLQLVFRAWRNMSVEEVAPQAARIVQIQPHLWRGKRSRPWAVIYAAAAVDLDLGIRINEAVALHRPMKLEGLYESRLSACKPEDLQEAIDLVKRLLNHQDYVDDVVVNLTRLLQECAPEQRQELRPLLMQALARMASVYDLTGMLRKVAESLRAMPEAQAADLLSDLFRSMASTGITPGTEACAELLNTIVARCPPERLAALLTDYSGPAAVFAELLTGISGNVAEQIAQALAEWGG